MADPDERTPADRIDATRRAARSLMLLLEAFERGEFTATPLEFAWLQAVVEALGGLSAWPEALPTPSGPDTPELVVASRVAWPAPNRRGPPSVR